QCYGDLTGCFHGNVTLTLDGVTQWREVRGCARAERCGPETRGDATARLSGSCCPGALCNGPPANRTLFSPDRPRLQLLPHGHAPTKGAGGDVITP
ncbi:LYPD3 protein, partial [Atlantisia rogersi]|nr:LYPD3 protein [Atlantisia rogersi]